MCPCKNETSQLGHFSSMPSLELVLMVLFCLAWESLKNGSLTSQRMQKCLDEDRKLRRIPVSRCLQIHSFSLILLPLFFFARAKFDTISKRNFNFELGKKPGLATHYPVGHLIDMHIMNLTRHVIE